MPYDSLADEANVPVSELKRMLRIAMANHVFYEVDGKAVCHNRFSWKLARDGDVIHGLPFFCDIVMPAIGKMVDRTTEWQVPWYEEEDKTARNLAFDDDLDFDEFLAQTEEAHGYSRLMNLLSSGRSLPSTCLAEVAHGTIDWYSLRKGALIVDVSIYPKVYTFSFDDMGNKLLTHVTLIARLTRLMFMGVGRAISSSSIPRSCSSGHNQ